MLPFGSKKTHLIVLRGNSGSGKSTVARELRQAYGRGIAWVEQDYLRRILLREHDLPGASNIGLIDQTVRYALDNGFHVILEGILDAGRYKEMLRGLWKDHAGKTHFYYFNIDFEETARRHATRPQSSEFSVDDMREWYCPNDTLDLLNEHVVDASLSLANETQRILQETGIQADNPTVTL